MDWTRFVKRAAGCLIAVSLFTTTPGCFFGHERHDDRDHRDDRRQGSS